MPIECTQLDAERCKLKQCPKCGAGFNPFMRGQVQRSKRFLWVLWPRDYCALICHACKEVVGWESPKGWME